MTATKKDKSFNAYLKYLEEQLGLNVEDLQRQIIRNFRREERQRFRELAKIRKERDAYVAENFGVFKPKNSVVVQGET
jgi:hypothetical protein